MKEVNRYTSNEFHDWQRKNLSSRFVLQDIDTWALAWADSQKSYEPIAIVELKRSYYAPVAWKPFEADKPNYLALFKLSQRAGLPLWIVYFKKGERIVSESLFHLFNVKNVREEQKANWMSYEDKIVKATDFIRIYPSLF